MARERFPTSGMAGLTADTPALAPVAERISGPYSGGWYLATYVVAVSGGYMAYSKICDARPLDVFECRATAKFVTPLSTEPAVALKLSGVLGEYILSRR